MGTESDPKPLGAALHNDVAAKATRRAWQLEPRLAAILEPILDQFGEQAAKNFSKHAQGPLMASGGLAAPVTVRYEQLNADKVGVCEFDADDSGGGADVEPDADDQPGGPVVALPTMVAVRPRKHERKRLGELASMSGDDADDMHVTLCYLGETTDDLDKFAAPLRQVAAEHAPMEGTVAGVGHFADNGKGHPQIMLPSVPGLVEARVAATAALHQAGIDYSRQYGYVPHMTAGYHSALSRMPSIRAALGEPVSFDAIHIVRGGGGEGGDGEREEIEIPLTGQKPLTAAAVVAESEVGKKIGEVAKRHAPDGGYGDTYWDAETGTVLWVEADWTSNDEVEAAEADFLAIPEVKEVEPCAECGAPEGDQWERVFATSALGLAAAAPPPPPDWTAPYKNQVIDVDKLVAQLRTKTDPVRLAVIEAAMTPALQEAGLDFDVTNPLTAKVLAQSGSQITNIAETTQQNVMAIIKKSYDEGLSIPDTAKAIRAGMKEAGSVRATLIARTELAGAVNGGSLAAAQIVSSATGGKLYKRWLTAPGARYPRHEDYEGLDGQTVSLDAYFEVGDAQLQHPGDPDGPPEEVCNC